MKYIHNLSGEEKVYHAAAIADGAFHLIPAHLEADHRSNTTLLADLVAGTVRMSSDGVTDYSSSPAVNVNYLLGVPSSLDSDGAPLVRTKIAPAGWHYQLHGVELTTSLLPGYYNHDVSGTDYGFITIKHYDASGALLTTQESIDTDCVKTVMDWEPTWDYEMIGGSVYQTTTPTSNFRFWITAVPDVPANMGGSVAFGTSVNLKYVSQAGSVAMDGRSPKRLVYNAVYHTNKLRITHMHEAGLRHTVLYLFELFKSS